MCRGYGRLNSGHCLPHERPTSAETANKQVHFEANSCQDVEMIIICEPQHGSYGSKTIYYAMTA